MMHGKRIVALIPARGGSKSIPYKNIKRLCGKPLLAWTIEAARQTAGIDRILVSTDDDRIAGVARKYGAEVLDRPAHLAQDDSLPIDVIRDGIARLQAAREPADLIVYLEPTCPLRKPEDIRRCLAMLADPSNALTSAATFKEADLHPHRAWTISGIEPAVFIAGAVPWLPRQQLPAAYQLNGAVYAFTADSLKAGNISILSDRCGAVVMPKHRSVDIDDDLDFQLAELLMRRGGDHD